MMDYSELILEQAYYNWGSNYHSPSPFYSLNQKIETLDKESIIYSSDFVLRSMDDMRNLVVRVRRNKQDVVFFYFDNEGVFREKSVSKSQIVVTEFDYVRVFRYDEDLVWLREGLSPVILQPFAIGNQRVHRWYYDAVIVTLIPGEHTIADFVSMYNEIARKVLSNPGGAQPQSGSRDVRAVLREFRSQHPCYQSPYLPAMGVESSPLDVIQNKEVRELLDDVIYRIERPMFCRNPDNSNKDTFDYIMVRMMIASRRKYPHRAEILKKYKKAVAKVGLHKITSSKKFDSYGIPENFLKIDNMRILPGDELEVTFGLKELSQSDSVL